MYYTRKIDTFLTEWKNDPDHLPLIVKGARQIGKTESILHFASNNYENVVYINFALQKKFLKITADGYDTGSSNFVEKYAIRKCKKLKKRPKQQGKGDLRLSLSFCL